MNYFSPEADKIQKAFNLYRVNYYGWEWNEVIQPRYLSGYLKFPNVGEFQVTWDCFGLPKNLDDLDVLFSFGETIQNTDSTFLPLNSHVNVGKNLHFEIHNEILPHIVLKGLYCLGYEISPLEKLWSHCLTSHEKIEAVIEFNSKNLLN